MQIEIDFEVFKRLTALRKEEGDTYNDVIRRLLKLKSPDSIRDAIGPGGYMAAGRHLPNGTKLKAIYKGKRYLAEVVNGRIRREEGEILNSLSAAAKSVTGNNVNGLRFWRAHRPADGAWILVASLPVEEVDG